MIFPTRLQDRSSFIWTFLMANTKVVKLYFPSLLWILITLVYFTVHNKCRVGIEKRIIMFYNSGYALFEKIYCCTVNKKNRYCSSTFFLLSFKYSYTAVLNNQSRRIFFLEIRKAQLM